MEAALTRVFIAVCRDPDSRPGDRNKALDHIAKMQGLYVERINMDARKLPSGMTINELMGRIAGFMGIEQAEATKVVKMKSKSRGALEHVNGSERKPTS